MSLLEIKSILEDILEILDELPPDIAQNQIPNRRRLRKGKLLLTRLKLLTEPYPALSSKVDIFIETFNQLYFYFRTGEVTPISIDVLRDKVKEYAERGIEKINENP